MDWPRRRHHLWFQKVINLQHVLRIPHNLVTKRFTALSRHNLPRKTSSSKLRKHKVSILKRMSVQTRCLTFLTFARFEKPLSFLSFPNLPRMGSYNNRFSTNPGLQIVCGHWQKRRFQVDLWWLQKCTDQFLCLCCWRQLRSSFEQFVWL